MPSFQEFEGKPAIWPEGIQLGRPWCVTCCDELTYGAAKVATGQGYTTEKKMPMMDSVPIVPVVRELLGKGK